MTNRLRNRISVDVGAGPRGGAGVPGVNSFTYLLRDEFWTDASAPLTSPHVCEPGPGTLTFVQVDGQYSISSGRLQMPAQSTPTTFDQLGWYQTDGQARVGGRMWRLLCNLSTLNTLFPLALSNTNSINFLSFARVDAGFSLGSGGILTWVFNQAGGVAQICVLAANVDYDLAIAVRPSAGGFLMLRESLEQKYRILFVGATGAAATLRGAQSNAAAVGAFDNLAEFDIADPTWQGQNSLATNVVASPTTGTTTTQEANALIEFTWTPAAGETLDLMVRRVDDNNCWIVRGSQAGSTIKLFEKVLGVETERATAAQTWTIGTPFRIVTEMFGLTYQVERFEVFVGTARKFGFTADAFNQFSTGVKVSGFTTGADLITWPLLVDDPEQFGRTLRRFLAYGDSKTMGTGDTSLLPWNSTAFPAILERKLGDATGQKWKETTRSGTSAATVATKAAAIAADLALITDTPEYILFNLGANDMGGALVEATWKANLRTILDAMHAKWANAHIYLMRPWRRTFTTSPTTIATWIGDVQAEAAYSGFVHLGPDERVFLENGDNGVTYTTDGVHPNRAGYNLTAAQWKTAIGY